MTKLIHSAVTSLDGSGTVYLRYRLSESAD
jgi:hypothetical protein